MKQRIKTESGSVYIIDDEKRTWKRVVHPREESDRPLRNYAGEFEHIFLELEHSMVIFTEPFESKADYQRITTSPVVSIEEIEEE